MAQRMQQTPADAPESSVYEDDLPPRVATMLSFIIVRRHFVVNIFAKVFFGAIVLSFRQHRRFSYAVQTAALCTAHPVRDHG